MITEQQKINRRTMIQEARARLTSDRIHAGHRFISAASPPCLCAVGALAVSWLLLQNPLLKLPEHPRNLVEFEAVCGFFGGTCDTGLRDSVYQLLEKEAGWSREELEAIENMYEGYPGRTDLTQRAYAWHLRQGPTARTRLLNLLQLLEDAGDGPLTLPEI
jgi:hypothetical protein